MIVTGVKTGINATGKTQNKKTVAGNFSAHLDEAEAADATAVSPSSASSPINSLFALQEIDEDEPRTRRQNVQRAQSMLDYLDEIRVGLLDGNFSSVSLERLEGLIKQWREQSSDPKLDSILDDIELRAAVELAKLEKIRS